MHISTRLMFKTAVVMLGLMLVAGLVVMSSYTRQASAMDSTQWETVRGYIESYFGGPQYDSGLEGEAGFRMPKTGTTGLLNRIDSNGNISPAATTGTGSIGAVTGVVGEGDDMANRPVMIDNLRTQTTIIPGTEFRCNWNADEDCYADASITAIRGLVDAHQEAGFSTDTVVYCVSAHTAAPVTGGFGIIAQVPGALASDTSLTPNVYTFEWARNGWRDNLSNPPAGSNTIGSTESSAGGFSAPSTSTCGSTTNDYDLVRCQANWAIASTMGNVGNGSTSTTDIGNAGQSVDIRTGSISTLSTTGTNLQIPINTLFSASSLADLDPTATTVMVSRTQHGGDAAIGLEMLGYNNIAGGFVNGGVYRWNSSMGELQVDQNVGLPLQTISSYGSPGLVETTAPTQSGINSQSVTSTSAVIERDASESATMKVAYGTTMGGPYTSTENNTVLNQTDKQVTLSGLTSGTTYYYTVTSYDGHANSSGASTEGSFTTLQVGQPTLGLSAGTPYWASYADYLAGELSIPMTVTNSGSLNAVDVRITGGTSNTSAYMINWPYLLGNIASGGGSAGTTVKYDAVGPGSFMASVTGSAEDESSNFYTYP